MKRCPFGYNVTVYTLSESLATLAENGPEATLSPHVFEKLLKVHSPVAKELFFRYRTILVCMYVCIQYIYTIHDSMLFCFCDAAGNNKMLATKSIKTQKLSGKTAPLTVESNSAR